MEETDKKTYEISFLARGEEAAGSVIQHLSRHGAEITAEQKIEPIELAYPIEKHNSAHFGCVHFAMDPDSVDTLKESLKFDEGILRYLIVTPPIVSEEEGKKPTRTPTSKKPVQETTPEGSMSNKDLAAKLEEISESMPESN